MNARFVRDEKTGKTKINLVLANGEEFRPRRQDQTGFTVKVALESSETVSFVGSQIGEKFSPDDFGPEVDLLAGSSRFFRCRIFIEE